MHFDGPDPCQRVHGIIAATEAGAANQRNGIDAAILLSDVRSTAAERLTAVSRRLQDANIAPLGVVENFCA